MLEEIAGSPLSVGNRATLLVDGEATYKTRNDEVNAVILGQDFGAEMEAVFADDIEASQEIMQEEWKSRPLPAASGRQ